MSLTARIKHEIDILFLTKRLSVFSPGTFKTYIGLDVSNNENGILIQLLELCDDGILDRGIEIVDDNGDVTRTVWKGYLSEAPIDLLENERYIIRNYFYLNKNYEKKHFYHYQNQT